MIAYGKGNDKRMPLALYKKRHSLAHIMAEAVLEFFPDAKPTIGPPVENGFYYDFAVPKPFTPEDLQKIEARMREIVQKGVDFSRREVSAAEAHALFSNNTFKLELIEGLTKGGEDDYGDKVTGGQGEQVIQSPGYLCLHARWLYGFVSRAACGQHARD